jgi:hypothetical protein
MLRDLHSILRTAENYASRFTDSSDLALTIAGVLLFLGIFACGVWLLSSIAERVTDGMKGDNGVEEFGPTPWDDPRPASVLFHSTKDSQ